LKFMKCIRVVDPEALSLARSKIMTISSE
jgi:hypothetical protein